MRRPAPLSLSDIRHPGLRAIERRPFEQCHATPATIELDAGQPLLDALGGWADKHGYCSAVVDLSDMSLSGFDYVMPDRAIDDRHAAWYSDTHSSTGARLEEAVAILGWRDGAWFAHIHAYWHEAGANHLGHLLPHTLSTSNPARIEGFGLTGARFEAELDPETEFTLFRVKKDTTSGVEAPNALITTLAPFQDLYESILDLSQHLPADNYEVFGLGSLAGTDFENAPPMTGLISEILLQKVTSPPGSACLKIPVRTVDLNGHLHQGNIARGQAPTLVTCELLLMDRSLTQS